MTPRSLPTYVCGALFAASRPPAGPRARILTTRGPVIVTLASDHRPWAVATGGAAGRFGHPVHEVRRVFLAWKRGRPIGMLVQTQCGSKLVTAELRWSYGARGRRCVRCPAIRASRELAQSGRALSARSHL